MVLIVVYLIGGLLLSDVTAGSCPCNNRTPFDTSAKATCSNMLTYSSSISGRNVSQCHTVTPLDYGCQVPPYNLQNDQSILHSEGSGYKFYRIFQPGYYSNECYSDSLFCAYNVQCASDQILYYHFTAHDIENPTQSSSSSCLDILSINRHSFPNQQLSSCGQVGINGATYGTYNVMQDGYDISSMSATFRSNKKCSATGYFIWVGCVDVSNNIPGFPITSSNTGFINVPLKGNFSYIGTTLVVRACMGRPLYYSNVRLLRVRYDGSSRIHSYRLPRRKLFHGEGKLYVRCRSRKHCVAYYKFIGVPYKHRLNQSERKKVAILLGASVDRFNGKGDYSTTFKNRTLVTESINQIIGLERNPSQGAQSYVSTEGIRTTNLKALAYELRRSSKPIVRSVGKFYLEKAH